MVQYFHPRTHRAFLLPAHSYIKVLTQRKATGESHFRCGHPRPQPGIHDFTIEMEAWKRPAVFRSLQMLEFEENQTSAQQSAH